MDKREDDLFFNTKQKRPEGLFFRDDF